MICFNYFLILVLVYTITALLILFKHKTQIFKTNETIFPTQVLIAIQSCKYKFEPTDLVRETWVSVCVLFL